MSDRDRLSIAAALATLLTSSALFPIFLGARWTPAVAGVIAVVAGCSIAARHLRLPPAVGPVLIGAGIVGYVTLIFAPAAAVAGIFPGPGAVRLLQIRTNQGLADIEALAPPVPTNPGLLLISVLGVALIALVADLLATTVRQPPAAGLPLLALFAVPAALAPSGVGIVPFALSVSGYLLLLATDGRSRLARWGRPLGAGAGNPLHRVGALTAVSYGEESPTGAMGRRIGLTAIGLALVVPLAIPALDNPLFAGNGAGSGGSGRGGTSVTTYNPIVRLHDQLTSPETATLLTLRTDEAKPVGYLRMAGLDVFDGRTWSQSSLRAGAADRISSGNVLPPPARPGATVTTAIESSDSLNARWLPLPYQPTAVRIEGDWRYENRTGSVFSTQENTRSRAYSVTSAALNVAPTVLNDALLSPTDTVAFEPYLTYPGDLPAEIKQTADDVVAKAKAITPYQRAVALQQYFRSGAFTYSLRVPPGNSDDVIVNFLRAKQGFCEQYAATMALFARMQGIPARVAVGFTYGQLAADGQRIITTKDAHAWPELYFPKAGWLPFEPTPVAGRGEAATPSYTIDTTTPSGPVTPDQTASAPRSPTDRFGGRLLDNETASEVPAEVASGGGSWNVRLLTGLALLPLLTGIPALIRAGIRRRRWRQAGSPSAAAHAAWADLRDDARDIGLVWPPSASPRGVAGWLRSRVVLSEGAASELDRLVHAEEQARYRRAGAVAGAGHADAVGVKRGEAAELRRSASEVRSALREQAGSRRRLRAKLLPASALDQLRRLTSSVAIAGDRYDRNAARWIRTLFRRRPATS